MDLGIQGKIALVCGASKGLGYASAEHLAREGAHVVIVARGQEALDEAVAKLSAVANGKIVAEGNPETLAGRDRMLATVRFSLPEGVAPPSQFALVRAANNAYEVKSTKVTQDLHDLTTWALGVGVDLEDLRVDRPTLEDVYLELTAEGTSSATKEQR